MNSTNFFRVGLVAAILLPFSGCDDSKFPLSDPQQAKPDARLTGLWRLQDEFGNTTYYHVGPLGGKAPASVLRVVSVTRNKDGELQAPSQMLAFPAQVGSVSCLNVAAQEIVAPVRDNGWKPEAAHSFFLLKYQFEGNTLLLWTMDPKAKEQAITAGKIKGEIERKTTSDKKSVVVRVRFTDTPENVARLIRETGDKLFVEKPLRLERVKPD